jgi:hypothetical protein
MIDKEDLPRFGSFTILFHFETTKGGTKLYITQGATTLSGEDLVPETVQVSLENIVALGVLGRLKSVLTDTRNAQGASDPEKN